MVALTFTRDAEGGGSEGGRFQAVACRMIALTFSVAFCPCASTNHGLAGKHRPTNRLPTRSEPDNVRRATAGTRVAKAPRPDKINNTAAMRHNQTATDFSQPESMLAAPLSGVVERARRRPLSLLARITFCFAWLFGLEPFLIGTADNRPARADDPR